MSGPDPEDPREADPDGGLGAVVSWVRDVAGEVAALPETLRSFREGVAQFREVTSRLDSATETIARVNAHGENTGLFDALRRLDATATALEREAVAARDRLPGREAIEAAARDMQTVLGALGGLLVAPTRSGRGATRPPGEDRPVVGGGTGDASSDGDTPRD